MQKIKLFSNSRDDVRAFDLSLTRGAKRHAAPLTLRFETMEGLNSDGDTVTRPLALWEIWKLKALIDEALDEHAKRVAVERARATPTPLAGVLQTLAVAGRGSERKTLTAVHSPP